MDDPRPDDARDPELQTLHELLEVMREHDLDRLTVRRGDAVYEIVRRESAGKPAAAGGPLPAMPAGGFSDVPPAAGANTKKIVAPLTGVFYRSASPDADAFVSVGDRVAAGDVLCILEAMKLFNEIQSDYEGTLVRVVPENGELVSQGAELFWIEP
ncbi:MAG TPA: biotin/lipoyl-containing protein [Candidatus Tumulicola sp.]|nr:biotin/lipoyl-containing protein [Candidatus Tumulicola sp.]